MTYKWHTSTYEWHTDDIRVHTSAIWMTYEYIRMTCMRFKRKIKLIFYSFLIILFPNIWFVKEFPACDTCFGLFTKIKKESGISFCCTFAAWLFHANAPYLILYQLPKFQCHVFFPSQDIKQNFLLSFYLDNWWRHKI